MAFQVGDLGFDLGGRGGLLGLGGDVGATVPVVDALGSEERVTEEREHRLVEPGLVQVDVGGVAGGMFFDRWWGPDRGFSPDHLHRWLTAITANCTGMTVADLVDEARQLEARLPHTHQALIPVQLRRTNRRMTVKRRSGPATPSGGLVAAMSGPGARET